jgi:hypothetical protein
VTMPVEETERSLRRLRNELGRLSADLERVRVRTAVWPVLTVAVLMLFWPVFNPAGATGVVTGLAESRADGEPVTVAGLWSEAHDSDLTFLTLLIVVAVALHLLLIAGLAVMVDSDSPASPRFVQVVSLLFGVAFLVLVIGINQDDGDGGFGREGYQPGGSWLLMLAMAAAAAGVAAWVRSEQS